MVKTLLLGFTLLLSAAWVLAQGTPTQAGGSPGASAATTVEGCLQSAGGGYTLTDKSGTTYQLSGDTSKLAEHVGHEVQITGTASAGSSGAGASASAGQAGGQTLTVDKIKHMSKTCKEGAE